MSSLSTFDPRLRLHAARLATVCLFVAFLVFLGFLIPFWIVLIVAAGMVVVARVVRAFRVAASKVEQILAEELPPSGRIG
ncbi:hypothetical protein DMH04_38145 [Kibdelosporangium aridum]|uniref:Uncharacterized protein n=1 Tax=Kibdelosporangium aridum TaxID=2030 RepID=A0A428YYP2_KIBAR|nr:hypothetical protein [Kibdelosporangium aridum]RSM75548.1 hypothetical protein DMH04_38145 [Kibdelosporangium aridum]